MNNRGEQRSDSPGWLGIASILAFLIVGSLSKVFFNAISFASDILPLREDFLALIGVDSDDPKPVDGTRALIGLVALVIVLLAVSVAPPVLAGFTVASDILPLPEDLREAIGTT